MLKIKNNKLDKVKRGGVLTNYFLYINILLTFIQTKYIH